MLNAITELFLSEYFKDESIVLPLLGDEKKLFDMLYDVFLLPKKDKSRLYKLVTDEDVRSVRTKSDYARLIRIRKYTELMDSPAVKHSDDITDIITIKGDALKETAKLGLVGTGHTAYTAYKLISECSNRGSLIGLRLVGMLQCLGVEYVSGSRHAGIKCLTKAAQWNCIEGLLLLMHFDESSRAECVTMLSTVVHGTPYEQFTPLAEERYGVKAIGYSRENKLLKKAFRASVLKPDVYSSQYARFLFSKVLNIKDKEQLLFAGSREAVSETADLPLKLDSKMTIVDEPDCRPISPERKNEFEKVLMCAMSGDLRAEPSYRPLCICSESEYLRMKYADVVTSVFEDANIEFIDVGTLAEYDFQPTKNNIFVRSCNEDVSNVYIMRFVGNINPGVVNIARNFLQSDLRRRFRLSHPSVEIDLSQILPVCICDKDNAKALKMYCDMVSIAGMGVIEKRAIIKSVISELGARYSEVQIEIEPSAMTTLEEFGVDKAESVLEKIIRFNRRKKSVITVTTDMLKDGIFGSDNIAFGFGGKNENK